MSHVSAFHQVDVFTDRVLLGNPLAVVAEADGLDDARMAAFAHWTQLSETTFLLPPTLPGADYRVRIFTPDRELPFAGHPTLGSCHVWLARGGVPQGDEVVQECAAGRVRIRRDGTRLAFAAPPIRRGGPVEPEVLERIVRCLRIDARQVRASQWVDNGPGWVAVMLGSREELLAIQPDFPSFGGLQIGAVAPWPGGEADFEVRALMTTGIGSPEDPVTGSLNASLAQWLIGAGLAPARYVARQGTVLGRAGRVTLERIGDTVWVGGEVTPCIEGRVRL